ncbi:MAG: methylated-DNA--[protein]-cysteine S-methyltransferase [Bacteroidetes bacterium]|nr:methylated-DNA--[protein]-cysteine S-methyltransferase [Bacteroidota bacterium]
MPAQVIWKTPLGQVLARAHNSRLTALHFLDQDSPPEPATDAGETAAQQAANDAVLALARQQLDEYFARQRQDFSVPLHLAGTPFQETVWQALQTIPYGQTRSYQEQARQMHQASAIRAIAAANGRNPIAVLVPCHRVLGAGGKLTGYSGGLWRKQALLDLEQPGLFG